MDAQDIRSLQEAYMDVYSSTEEIDEGKSFRPRYPGGRGDLGLEGSERRTEKRDAAAENMRGHTEGPGTITKNPKKLRKQKAMGELRGAGKAEVEEGYIDIYDIILSHLLDEGYAETPEAAEAIMVNMSEDWREDICEGYKKFPYKKVEDKIHKKEADNPTGRGTPQSVKMGKVFRHFKGEVRRTERRENSPKISKSKESENRARGTQKG